MNQQLIWEIIGYCGSALVLVSLLMSSVVKLRIINTIGSLIFCIYAFQIRSIPTAIMNLALVFINLFFLYKLLVTKSSFRIAKVTLNDSTVQTVLKGYQADVEKYFGKPDLEKADIILAVYKDDTVVGVSAGVANGDELELILDYSTPAFRDCSVGRFVMNHLFEQYGTLVYTGSNSDHIAYVQKLGYQPVNGRYEIRRPVSK